MRTAFIGHRQIFAKDIYERLTDAVRNEIDSGCKSFIMGMHGQFDDHALHVCKKLRETFTDMEIEVAITSLHAIKKKGEFYEPYSDVKTVMYDIENAHYKQRITLSNRQMIDHSDTLICYVDTSKTISGAKTALRYAEKCGLKIVNLYRETDDSFYGMTEEQKNEYWENVFRK